MSNRIEARAFTRTDIPGVHALISAVWRERRDRAYLHIGDFYWAMRPGLEFVAERDIRLWSDGHKVAAFAWFDGFDSGDYVVSGDAPDAIELDAIAWLEDGHRRYAPSEPFGIGVMDDDGERRSVLEERGYRRADAGDVRFWQRIDPSFDAPMPDGFRVNAVRGADDIERRVYVQHNSFESSTATPDVWRALAELPGYRRDLDLVVIAPDGTGAAGCTIWYDEANRAGEFEPVGTSRAFQRRGIGKALLAEGLRRLYAFGAEEAIVRTNITNAPAIALYRSAGFHLTATQHRWEKGL